METLIKILWAAIGFFLSPILLANSTFSEEIIYPEYYKNSYPITHWALHLPAVGDDNFIAILKIQGIPIALKLNVTDARGYRSMAVLVADREEAMFSTLNRSYTFEEKHALNTALCILTRAYEYYGLIAQTEIAGNNSQSLTEKGTILLGNEKEPAFLHGHIIGRGNPNTNYISSVPLRGPKAGIMFNMRGDGMEEGNEAKVKWQDHEMKIIAEALATQISFILSSALLFPEVILVSKAG